MGGAMALPLMGGMIMGSMLGGGAGGGAGGGSSSGQPFYYPPPPTWTQPDTSELEARHKEALAVAEKDRAKLEKQLGDLAAKVTENAEAQKAKDAEIAKLRAVVDAIEAEKAAKEAEFKRRHDEEAARIRAIGLDNKNHFNIAFCGVSGTGKSTVINALRKLYRGDPGYADTMAGAECTSKAAKYAHPQVPYLMLWDIPGGGTDAHPGATYFSDKCLDLFDLLVLCYDGRWSEVNSQIVKEAAKKSKNIVILYTKADNHVSNKRRDDPRLSEEAAFAGLTRTVEENASKHLTLCKVAAVNVPIFLIDAFGIRDSVFKFHEVRFIRAIVTSTALRLGRAPEEVWAAFQEAAPAVAV